MGIKLSLSPEYVQMPIGSVIAVATPTVPVGFLECNGAAISRTSYATLFGLIGTYYGSGNGSTTFNLPDLRGEFIRGHDNSRGVDSGRTFGSFQDADTSTSSHNHGGVTTGTSGTASTTISYPVTTRVRNIAMKYVIKY